MVLLVFNSLSLFTMKKASLYLAMAAMASLTLSCKKDSDTATPAPATKTDLLTAKNWKMTDLKVGGVSIFNSGFIDACDKDNLIKFNTNKTAVFDEGPVKCVSTDPQTRNGSWDFTTSETKLKVTDPDGVVAEGTIGTLNSTTLIVSDPNFSGSNQSAEVTYTAQ